MNKPNIAPAMSGLGPHIEIGPDDSDPTTQPIDWLTEQLLDAGDIADLRTLHDPLFRRLSEKYESEQHLHDNAAVAAFNGLEELGFAERAIQRVMLYPVDRAFFSGEIKENGVIYFDERWAEEQYKTYILGDWEALDALNELNREEKRRIMNGEN